MGALQTLLALYERRLASVPGVVDGLPTLTHVGADVPREVVTAAGFVPFRLSGRPGFTAAADGYCGPGIDRVSVSRLARLLSGEAAESAGLVLSADNEGSVRLFLYLREIQRLEVRGDLPRMTFLDLVHLSQRTSTVYDRARLDALVHELGEWAGRPVTDDDLRAAAGVHDRVRALIRTVGARLRRGSEGPRLTGTQALAVIGASFVSAPERWSAEAAALLEAADLPVHRGVRVFLTGCDHDHPAAYELVESLGAVVVGEDHDWGDLAGVGEIGTPGDVRSALVRLRAHGAPASAGHSAAVRAAQTARMARAAGAEFVVAWSRPFDDGPPWDVPVQRRALEEIGIPLVAVPAQPYGGGNDDEVRELLARALRDPARLPMGVLR